jgi:hypothetical protein
MKAFFGLFGVLAIMGVIVTVSRDAIKNSSGRSFWPSFTGRQTLNFPTIDESQWRNTQSQLQELLSKGQRFQPGDFQVKVPTINIPTYGGGSGRPSSTFRPPVGFPAGRHR